MKRILILLLVLAGSAQAQLLVSDTLTPAELAQLISGEGVQILNPQVDCGTQGYGKYNATGTSLGISEGLLLTTGTINNAIGPNDVGNATAFTPPDSVPDGYTLLDNYTGRTTWEYCEFEFDIIPQGDTITFDFVFASEEYEEWVGSQYNDVFGFFISGPGIVGDPGAGGQKNIALLPNTTTPVTINDVNQNLNTAYYENNAGGQFVQYDGYTKGLYAQAAVQPCETYHLRLVVADCSDKLWDSGVFIEKIKSNNILVLSQTAGNIDNMVEGCNQGFVSFTRQVVDASPLTIDYWIAGTATNGVDYDQIGADPDPVVAKQITIPANQATVTLPINPIADGLVEGTEYLKFYLGNPYCSSQITDSLVFELSDSLFPSVSPLVDSICIGDDIELTATGGSGFSWTPDGSLSDASNDTTLASPTSTTTYTMTTTASLCSESMDLTIHVSNIQQTGTITDITCNGLTNGAIDVTTTGGLGTYSYLWSGPNGFTSVSEDLTGLEPGAYTVNVTDGRGCVVQFNYTVTEPVVLFNGLTGSEYDGAGIECNGGSNGYVDQNITGGTTPYSISWTGPSGYTSSQEDITGLSAGTYTSTITDANGCTTNASVTLIEPDPIASTAVVTEPTCFEDCDGAINLSPSGGMGGFSFVWSSGDLVEDISGICAGDYDVDITDANGCSESFTYSVGEPTDITLGVSSTNSNCSQSDGSVVVAISGGTPGYTVLWDDLGASTTQAVSGLPSGSYTVVVTDAAGCTQSESVSVSDLAGGTATVTVVDDATCFEGNDGELSVSMAGGTAPYSYSWSSGGTGTNETGLTAGNYSVTVTDFVGCVAVGAGTIAEPDEVTAAITITNTDCFGSCDGQLDAVVTGGTGPYNVTWDDPLGQNSTSAMNLCAGLYRISITDSEGCLGLDSATVLEPQDLMLTAVADTFLGGANVSCVGATDGVVDLTVTGGTTPYNYSWVGPNGFVSTNPDITSLEAGLYTSYVTDNNGCLDSVKVTLTEPALLSLTLTPAAFVGGNNISCNGASDGSIDLTVSGGFGPFDYAWTGTTYTGSVEDPSALEADCYDVVVTDTNGCVATGNVCLTEPTIVETSASSTLFPGGYHLSCAGANDGVNSATSTGGIAPYGYSWTGPNGFTSSTDANTNLEAGTYYLTSTDANGCVAQDSIVLTTPDSLMLTLFPSEYIGGVNITCKGDSSGYINSAVTGGNGGLVYSWTSSNGMIASTSGITGIPAGTYTLQVTDVNGCVITMDTTLVEPAAELNGSISASMSDGGTNISCYGANDAWMEIMFSGGTSGYTIDWRGPNNYQSDTAYIENLVPGVYEVAIVDTNACVMVWTTTVTEPDQLSSTISADTAYCEDAIATIDLFVQGGIPTYEYLWSNGSNDQDPTGLVEGEYSVIISDTNDCNIYDTIYVESTRALNASITNSSPLCYGDSMGSIAVSISSGSAPFTYAWSTGESTAMIDSIGAGTYWVLVNDMYGCNDSLSTVIGQPDSLEVTLTPSVFIGGSNIACIGDSSGAITSAAIGGSGGFTYAWTGPNGYTATSGDISGVAAGTYLLSVTDGNGCVTTIGTTLAEPATSVTGAVTASTTSGGTMISCNGGNDGWLDVTYSGGTPGYTVAWTGPSGFTSDTSFVDGLLAGDYDVVVTDTNGCEYVIATTVTEPADMTSTVTADTAYCEEAVASIDLTVQGGSPNYSYNWDNADNVEDPQGLLGGAYNVTVTDVNGCTHTTSITVNSTPSVSASTTETSTLCYGDSTGSIVVDVTTGTSPYSYVWSNGATTSSVTGLNAGEYWVVVTDVFGCTDSVSTTVTQPDSLEVVLSSPEVLDTYNVSSYGGSDGTAESTVYGGTSPYNYLWSTGDTDDAIYDLIAGTYNVVVTDDNGCVGTASIEVISPDMLQIPSALSPNGDGFNDYFVVKGLDVFENNTFTVFNQWGNEVYSTNSYQNDWDGVGSSGNALPDGTYFVILVIQGTDTALQGYVDIRR